ncbi:MAG: glycosyltransferase family 4 protein [Pseudomonadota bacterium]
MRILSILPFSPPSPSFGGAERQMHSLHKGLVTKGVDIHVLADISAVGKPYQDFEGIPVWGVPFPVLTSSPWRPGNLKFWMAWRTIRKIVHTHIPRPDLIQVTTFRQPAMVGHWLARLLNVPWTVRLACSGSYGDLRFAGSNWLSRRVLPKMARSVSGVVALDSVTRQEAIDHGVLAERIEIIPNALVLQRTPRSSIERRSIVFIGRLAQQKKIDSLLIAYSQLRERSNEVPPLLIAGAGAESTMLEELAGRLKIAGECEFLGAIPGPEDVLDRACCFINPSGGEGLPNAVLEALAFGVPVILSDIPVHRQLAMAVGMEDYLFPVGDSQVLATKLQNFLSLGDSEKQILRHRCTEYAQQFTRSARDDAYLTLYQRILEERGGQCC